MKIIADTNVLLRAVLPDTERQREAAIEALKSAETVAISIHALCEVTWVLARRYAVSRTNIADAIRHLTGAGNVIVNRPAVEAGLRLLEAGGDFADGAIDYEGQWLGGETFVSFDKRAVKLLNAQGRAAKALA